jgi:hypothetical protein
MNLKPALFESHFPFADNFFIIYHWIFSLIQIDLSSTYKEICFSFLITILQSENKNNPGYLKMINSFVTTIFEYLFFIPDYSIFSHPFSNEKSSFSVDPKFHD